MSRLHMSSKSLPGVLEDMDIWTFLMDRKMVSDVRGGIGDHGGVVGWVGLSNDLGHEFELWVVGWGGGVLVA